MFGFFAKDKKEILAMPMNGKVLAAKDIPDEAFAQEMMGPTLGIEPADGRVYAPFDGEIDIVFDAKHAITLTSREGMEILIHVGLDTAKLAGAAFTAQVAAGQAVNKGDLLLEADLAAIKAAGLSTVTPVVICNADEYKKVTKNMQASQKGEELFAAEKE